MTRYVVNIQTIIFGGGKHWKPVVEKSETEILKDYVTKPEFFSKKVYAGKVYSTEGTKYLKEGVAFVDTTKEYLRVGLGHGGLLGGLDQECLFHPVSDDTFKQVSLLYDDMKIFCKSPTDADIIDFVPKDKRAVAKKYFGRKKIEGDVIKRKALEHSRVSKTRGMAVVPKQYISVAGLKQMRSTDDVSKIDLISRELPDKKLLGLELQDLGLTLKDLRDSVVFYSEDIPFIFRTKKGEYVVVAPRTTDMSDVFYDAERQARRHLESKEKEIQQKIESIVDEERFSKPPIPVGRGVKDDVYRLIKKSYPKAVHMDTIMKQVKKRHPKISAGEMDDILNDLEDDGEITINTAGYCKAKQE